MRESRGRVEGDGEGEGEGGLGVTGGRDGEKV